MIRERNRICDVCGDGIPKGTKYSKSTMPAEAAALLAAGNGPGTTPTWTVNADGTITMDICQECEISMGPGTAKGPSH